MNLYISLGTVLLLLAITAPVSLAFGFAGAMASRSSFLPLSLLGKAYTSMVRGVPDIVFFLFFIIALDQALAPLQARFRKSFFLIVPESDFSVIIFKIRIIRICA